MKDSRATNPALRRQTPTQDVAPAQRRAPGPAAQKPAAQLPPSAHDADASAYLDHLSEVAASTGLDVSGYLPQNAPPSWTRQVRPWYRVLAWERSDSATDTATAALSPPRVGAGLLAEDEDLLAEMTRMVEDEGAERAGPAPRAYTGERGEHSGEHSGAAHWRVDRLPVADEAGWAVLHALSRDLPSPAPAPPLAGVHEALGGLLGLRGDVAPGPVALADAIREQGAPEPASLDALQTGFAPYPDFAHAASLQVDALQSMDVAGVEASAVPVMRRAESSGRWDPARVQALMGQSRGGAMPDALRERMGSALGQPLPGVVIHTDEAAAKAAEALNARAFAQGYHLYFGAGAFTPGTAEGDELLAHELTHVLQYDQGRLDASSGGMEVSSPTDQAEQEAERAGRRAATSLQTGPELNTRFEPGFDQAVDLDEEVGDESTLDWADSSAFAAARWGVATGLGVLGVVAGTAELDAETIEDAPVMGGWLGDLWDAVSDGVSEVWDGVVELGSDALMLLVRSVAPDLANLIEQGPATIIQDVIAETVGGWVEGLLGDFDLGGIIETISVVTAEVGTTLAGVAAGDAACCETFGQWMSGISDVINGILNNPAIEAIKSIMMGVQSVAIDLFAMVIEPQFEMLQTILGGAWSAITAVVDTVSGWFATVRDFASDAWDWVCEALGFGGGEGGVWEWLKEFAQEAWATVQETFAPVIEPLKTIGTILVALSPLGMIYGAFQVAGEFLEVAGWLWDNWGDPDLFDKAHDELGHTVLPGILDAGKSFADAFSGIISGLGEGLAALATAALQLLGAVTGMPLLSIATGFIQTLSDGITAASSWVTGTLSSVGSSIADIASGLWAWAKPIIEVCISIGLCILNPAMIPIVLAGWAWQALPDCIKAPIIDLLLDIVIGVLQATPDLLILGPLWLVMKPGILGFLEQVRGMAPEAKVVISNKVARFMTGASLDFIFGFVGGFLKGIWEGITDPFVLAWMLFKGLVQLGDWLGDMAVNAFTGSTETAAAPDLSKQAIGLGSHVVGRVVGGGFARSMDGPAARMGDDGLEALSGGVDGLPANARAAVEEAFEEVAPQVTPKIAGRLSRKATARSATASAGAEGEQQRQQAPQTDNERNQQAMQEIASQMWSDLGGKISELAAGFGPAVEEFFAGGEGMSFSGLMESMGSMWPQIQQGIHDLGGTLAQQICAWFYGDAAEGEMGNAIGWLTGTILFEIVLFYFTAGAGTAIVEGSRILKYLLKFMDWTGAALGAAFKGLSKLGGFLLKIGKGIGSMLSAAGGRIKAMVDLVVEIGEKFIKYAGDLLSKVGKGGDGAVAREAAEEGGERVTREAAEEGGERVTRETAEEGGERAGREAAEEGGEQGGKKADDVAAAAEKKRAEAMARSVIVTADLQNWEIAVLAAALAVIAANHKAVHRFDTEREGDGEYTIWMIASRKKIAQDVDLRRQGAEDIPGYQGRLEKRRTELLEQEERLTKEYEKLLDELDTNPKAATRIDELDAELDRVNGELRGLNDTLGEGGEVAGRVEKQNRITEADEVGDAAWQQRKADWADETLAGGRKLDEGFWRRIEDARTPDEITAAKAEIASIRAEIAGSSRSNRRDLLMDLTEREARLDHRMRLSRVMDEVPSGGWTDEALEQRIVSGGKGDVYANSQEQAQTIANRLENRARVDDGNFDAGNFHGPERHRGSRPQFSQSANTAPEDMHINVKGTLDGQHFESHIYFPTP